MIEDIRLWIKEIQDNYSNEWYANSICEDLYNKIDEFVADMPLKIKLVNGDVYRIYKMGILFDIHWFVCSISDYKQYDKIFNLKDIVEVYDE